MSVSQLKNISRMHVVVQSLFDQVRWVVSCQMGYSVTVYGTHRYDISSPSWIKLKKYKDNGQ